MGKEMSKILPGLYIGKLDNAQNDTDMMANCITHVLSIHEPVKQKLTKSNSYVYHNINVKDVDGVCISKYFSSTNDFIHDARCKDGKVLVHCLAGVSRAPTIVMAYIMTIYHYSFQNAYNCLRAVHRNIKPNQGFLNQLQEYEASGEVESERNRLIQTYGDWKNLEDDKKLLNELLDQYNKQSEELYFDSSIDSSSDNSNGLYLSFDNQQQNAINKNNHNNNISYDPPQLSSPLFNNTEMFGDNGPGEFELDEGLLMMVGQNPVNENEDPDQLDDLDLKLSYNNSDNILKDSGNEENNEDEEEENEDIPGSIPIHRQKKKLGFMSMTANTNDYRGRVHSRKSYDEDDDNNEDIDGKIRKTSVPSNNAPDINQINSIFDNDFRYGQTAPIPRSFYLS